MILTSFRRWQAGLVLVAIGATGCSASVPEQVVVENSFEGAPPAGIPTALLTTEQAHSGQQAGKVGQEAEFAPLSDNTWADFGQAHHLRLRLWSWLPDRLERNATLVVSTQHAGPVAGAPAKIVSYQAFNLCEVVRRYRQWVPNTFFVSLPRTLLATDKINVYLWVPPGQIGPVYVDDYSIEKLD